MCSPAYGVDGIFACSEWFTECLVNPLEKGIHRAVQLRMARRMGPRRSLPSNALIGGEDDINSVSFPSKRGPGYALIRGG